MKYQDVTYQFHPNGEFSTVNGEGDITEWYFYDPTRTIHDNIKRAIDMRHLDKSGLDTLQDKAEILDKILTLPGEGKSYYDPEIGKTKGPVFDYNRDSGPLEKSNFEAIKNELPDGSFEVGRISPHFLVGWSKEIIVDATRRDVLEAIEEVQSKFDVSPILDEERHNQKKLEALDEQMDFLSDSLVDGLVGIRHIPDKDELTEAYGDEIRKAARRAAREEMDGKFHIPDVKQTARKFYKKHGPFAFEVIDSTETTDLWGNGSLTYRSRLRYGSLTSFLCERHFGITPVQKLEAAKMVERHRDIEVAGMTRGDQWWVVIRYPSEAASFETDDPVYKWFTLSDCRRLHTSDVSKAPQKIRTLIRTLL